MSDNCTEEINALRSCWPDSEFYLCIVHIFKQVWRWLLDQNNVSQNERQEILMKFKSSVYETNQTTFLNSYHGLLHLDAVFNNNKAHKYLADYLFRKNILISLLEKALSEETTQTTSVSTISSPKG